MRQCAAARWLSSSPRPLEVALSPSSEATGPLASCFATTHFSSSSPPLHPLLVRSTTPTRQASLVVSAPILVFSSTPCSTSRAGSACRASKLSIAVAGTPRRDVVMSIKEARRRSIQTVLRRWAIQASTLSSSCSTPSSSSNFSRPSPSSWSHSISSSLAGRLDLPHHHYLIPVPASGELGKLPRDTLHHRSTIA